ncbi:MAG: gluconokinase [Anaerolineales bacterium]
MRENLIPPAIVVMGVSGCGKSTVGRLLAERLGWPFFDADDFHPPENIARMTAGQPLSDADRAPWLDALHTLLADHLRHGQPLVLACSALKEAYRQRLAAGGLNVRFVHLQGGFDLIYRRMQARQAHYMRPEMLHSQFADLEAPTEALTLDIRQPPAALVTTIVHWLEKG